MSSFMEFFKKKDLSQQYCCGCSTFLCYSTEMNLNICCRDCYQKLEEGEMKTVKEYMEYLEQEVSQLSTEEYFTQLKELIRLGILEFLKEKQKHYTKSLQSTRDDDISYRIKDWIKELEEGE